jgi:hypothetical protein
MARINTAATGRDRSETPGYRTTGIRLSLSNDSEHMCQFRLDILEAQSVRARPRDDHEVMGRLQFFSMNPEKFSYSSLHSVSPHRRTDFATNGDAEPWLGLGSRNDDHCEVWTLPPAARALNPHEV